MTTEPKILITCASTEKICLPSPNVLMGGHPWFEKLCSKWFCSESIYFYLCEWAAFSKNFRSTLFFSVPHKINPDEQTLARKLIFGGP